jgi:membrane-associated phospholipid phosphatase
MERLLQMLEWIQTLRVPALDHVFVWITVLGEEYFAIGVLCLILWCVSKRAGYAIGFAYLTSWILNFSIKEIFHIQRPFALDKNITPIRPETATGYSFPSGHTMSTASLCTAVAAAFRKKWIYAVGTVLVVLMAVSRMYLGVHTLLDVAVGVVVGIAWVFAANLLFGYVERMKRPALLLIMLLPMAVAMIFVQDNDYYKIAGTFTSFLIGYLLDSRFIHYETKSKLLYQVIKFVLGMAVLIGIKQAGKMLLGDSLAADYIRYLIIGLWITVLAPMLYKKFLSAKPAATVAKGG